METIDLYKAIDEMRAITAAGGTFSFKHRKWNRHTGKGGDIMVVKSAKIRPKASDEAVENSSHKLYYTDTDSGQAKVCWQVLVVEFNGKRTVLN